MKREIQHYKIVGQRYSDGIRETLDKVQPLYGTKSVKFLFWILEDRVLDEPTSRLHVLQVLKKKPIDKYNNLEIIEIYNGPPNNILIWKNGSWL